MRHFICLALGAALAGCASYRSNSGGFRGPGPFTSNVKQNPMQAKVNRGATQSGLFRLSWPVTQVRLNRGFNEQSNPHHYGVDLGGKQGTPIYAAHSGTVIYTGHRFNGYGNMVMVEYDNHWATLYAHLTEIHASEGQRVGPGDQIGTMGRSGRASGVHLHFEVMRDRMPIDPGQLLSEPPRNIVSR